MTRFPRFRYPLPLICLVTCLVALPGAVAAQNDGSDTRDQGVTNESGTTPTESGPSPEVLANRLFLSEDGVLHARDAGTWNAVTEGLPTYMVYPFEDARPVRLTSASAAPGYHDRMVATSGTDLYVHDGDAWGRLTNRSEFGTYAYLTASAVSPADRQDILVGTSFHGIYRSTDGGATWRDLSPAFDNLARGAHYVDDFAALAVAPDGTTAYAAVRLGTELYTFDLESRSRRRLSLPTGARRITALSVTPGGALEAMTENAVYRLSENGAGDDGGGSAGTVDDSGMWVRLADLPAEPPAGEASSPVPTARRNGPASEDARARMATAADRYGMYVPFLQAQGDALEAHIDFAKEHGINAFVIDLKDDRGRITYDTDLQMPRDVGAVRQFIDIDALSRRLEEAGIYFIGRQVVFKDEQLYHFDDNRLAIRDARSGDPWGFRYEETDEESGETVTIQREHWVDPFSEEVWDYNVAIAEELERRGVDEIQFDYIRFPSDGPVAHMTFPHRRDRMRRVDALESFLAKARDNVTVPLGTDVFGFNGWYEMDYLAQNIAMIARHIDVISPMYYPSHFDSRFLGDRDFYRRARDIYRVGSERARIITQDAALIRPYVQAFLIGRELRLEEPEYSRYLTEQIEGSLASGTEGFLLWNFSGRYYMVVDSLREYTAVADAGRDPGPGENPPHLD